MNNPSQMRTKIFITIMTTILFFIASQTMALETNTHRDINEYIAQNIFSYDANGTPVTFSLNNYLKTQLGMQSGIKSYFEKNKLNQQVLKWVGDGGEYEDKPPECSIPYQRSPNHYLNPLNHKGFSGLWGTSLFNGDPADYWAMYSYQAQYCGDYSWNDARYYYYRALWSNSKTESEKYFAETFRAVGQLMHLVQDMSVPAHTRNNQHLLGDGYENWAKTYIIANTLPNFNPDKQLRHFFIPDNNKSLNIQNLFFTNQYTNVTLYPNVTLQGNIGLSEYTNANFFSPDTIFTADYPYPAYLPGITMDPNIQNGVLYLKKVGYGEDIDHLARANNLYNYLPPDYKDLALHLNDDIIYKEYAKFLIPRAIGYSSQSLNYFFRGEIEAKLLPVFDESKLESVRIKVRNITPLKDSMGGNNDSNFYLAYRYTPPGAPADGSQDIWSKVPYVYPLTNALLYYKDNEGNELEGPSYETEILFGGFPVDIPISNYQNAKFMLIYRGDLGEEKVNLANNESGGIIGKFGAAKPITFHEEFNTAPKGDYNWFQMDSPVFGTNMCTYHNIEHGVAQNEIVGGKLIKTNIRYPITDPSGFYPGAHFNLSLIGVHNLSGNTYANNIFPIPITKDTYIEFKIDDMTISPNTAASGNFTHYQGMVLYFNNGYKLELSLNDQFWYINNTTGYFTFPAGYVILDNIHNMFAQYNLPVPADFKLNYIGLHQQIGFDLPLNTQYEQKMIVDFIRIVEMEKMEPKQQ